MFNVARPQRDRAYAGLKGVETSGLKVPPTALTALAQSIEDQTREGSLSFYQNNPSILMAETHDFTSPPPRVNVRS